MDLAKISPDLKNLVRNCYVSRLVQVSLGFGEKIRDQTEQIRFWRRKPATNRSMVGPGLVGFTEWVRPLVELDIPLLNNEI